MRNRFNTIAIGLLGVALALPASAAPFAFSTGLPDGKIATASRPDAGGLFEIESADDFALSSTTTLSSATFTGLMPTGGQVQDVIVEIYRVFPFDSDIGRTSGPTIFSTPQVPTRVNSPSDVQFTSADGSDGSLTFSTSIQAATFTALNSVTAGGIHPLPGIQNGGTGPATGEEVEFDVNFTSGLTLAAGHYFFVPQVELLSGDFLWLSASRPIVAPGTPFPPGVTDLQSWTRDEALDPDWLRIGTDIVGGTTFNSAFTLAGTTDDVPEPMSLLILGAGLFSLRRRRP